MRQPDESSRRRLPPQRLPSSLPLLTSPCRREKSSNPVMPASPRQTPVQLIRREICVGWAVRRCICAPVLQFASVRLYVCVRVHAGERACASACGQEAIHLTARAGFPVRAFRCSELSQLDGSLHHMGAPACAEQSVAWRRPQPPAR